MAANSAIATRPIEYEARVQKTSRELVLLAKDGDADAFGLLYDNYLERIYRYIYFRVTDEQTAEDLASQVFCKAWENLDRYKPSGAPFEAWL